jgi:capsular polysaccharide biosynthesis protein/Mrp family chromosome partitioning ATPase
MTPNNTGRPIGTPYRADGADEAPVPFSDYLRVLGRRKLLLVIGLILGLALGALFAKAQSKTYQSTAQVQVNALPTNLTSTNNLTTSPPNMETESAVATSQQVAEKALSGITSAHKKLTTKMIQNDVSVTFPNKSTILTFKCTASNPHDAQVICQAITDAYVSVRTSNAQNTVTQQVNALKAQQKTQSEQLQTAETALGAAPAGTTAADSARATVSALQGQLSTTTSQINQLSTLQIDAGKVVVPANIGKVTGLSSKVIIAAGGLIGLVLFMAIAFLVDKADDRIRVEDDIERMGLPVVADLPRPTSADQKALNDPSSWPSAKRRAYGKLAARVLVASRKRELSVITLMGVGDEPTDRLVAANFAVALAQAGRRVNLVLTGAGGGSAASHSAPARSAPGTPGLPATQSASPELLPSPVNGLHFTELTAVNGSVNMDAADFLSGDLRRGADFVIVAAPPMTTAADSLVLASVSDATILVANEKTSRRGELGEAADSLVQIGAPLFGVVLARKGGRKSRRHRAADRRAGSSLSMADVPDIETIRQP